MEYAQATGRRARKSKAGFIGAPEYLSGKMQEGYGTKHDKAERERKG
jgi:hypothetical protein